MSLTDSIHFQKGDEEAPFIHLSDHHPMRGWWLWDTNDAHLRRRSHNFHHHLINSVVLNFRPNPSNSLRLQTRFQFTRQKLFLSLWVLFHRNFLLRESIFLSTHLQSGENDRKYVGMTERISLIIVILLPRETFFSNMPVFLHSINKACPKFTFLCCYRKDISILSKTRNFCGGLSSLPY